MLIELHHFSDQRLDLCKSSPDDPTPVKGQIIISLLSRDAITGTGNPGLAIVGPAGDVRGPEDDETVTEQRIPEGWEDRRTPDGRVYYVNHVTRTTQWTRPTQPASAAVTNGQNGTETNIQTPPGPSRSSTMNNIEQSPSNGSLNIEPAPGSRRHSTENLIGTTNGGEISNSSSTNSIENKIAASSPTSTAPAISSPRNSILVQSVQVNSLTSNLTSLAIDTNSTNTNDANDSQQAPATTTTTTTPTTNSSSARLHSKTTNLSPTQQQQVPPNTTAPLNGPPRSGSRSPPTTNLQRDDHVSQPGTPQRPAEVIQNRNAADGEFWSSEKLRKFNFKQFFKLQLKDHVDRLEVKMSRSDVKDKGKLVKFQSLSALECDPMELDQQSIYLLAMVRTSRTSEIAQSDAELFVTFRDENNAARTGLFLPHSNRRLDMARSSNTA